MAGIVYVPDMAVVHETSAGKILLSRRSSRVVKDGTLMTFTSGCGKVKDGKLYVLSPVALFGDIVTEGNMETIRLTAIVDMPLPHHVIKVQIKNGLYPEWRDYEILDMRAGNTVILPGPNDSGIYRVIVTDTSDYTERISNEVEISTSAAIKFGVYASNHLIFSSNSRYGTLSTSETTLDKNSIYEIQQWSIRDNDWLSLSSTLGNGEGIVRTNIPFGRFRCAAMDMSANKTTLTQEIGIKFINQLILSDVTSYDPNQILNSDIRKKLARTGDTYENFNIRFCVGGTGSLFDKVVLKRFVRDTLSWTEISSTDITMEDASASVASGDFSVNIPGRYRAEAVNLTSGEKIESNFIILSE